MVGGAIRDAAMGRTCHDYDFVVDGDVRSVSKDLANVLSGNYYVLDDERNTTRIIIYTGQGNRVILDFAAPRADDIDTDLRLRDLTIDAIAVDMNKPLKIIDPLNGMTDIKNKIVRACYEKAFADDPIRILRAIRVATNLGFKIEHNTLSWIKSSVNLIPNTSPERVRDELFRMLDNSKAASMLRLLKAIDGLKVVFSMDGDGLSEINQWNTKFTKIEILHKIFSILIGKLNTESADNLLYGSIVLHLGQFRWSLEKHFSTHINSERSLKSLIAFSALVSLQQESEVAIDATAKKFVLSNDEYKRLNDIRIGFGLINHWIELQQEPNNLDIYRYFKKTGPAGIDSCFVAIAHTLALSEGFSANNAWEHLILICKKIMHAWWKDHSKVVSPPKVINGDILQEQFNLDEGKAIGNVLELIREAQVCGQVNNIEEALIYAQEILARGRK